MYRRDETKLKNAPAWAIIVTPLLMLLMFGGFFVIHSGIKNSSLGNVVIGSILVLIGVV